MGKYLTTMPYLCINGKFEQGLIYIYRNNTWEPVETTIYTDRFKLVLGQGKLGEKVLNGG